MPGRRATPRHRTPQTLKTRVSRLVGDVAGLVPSTTATRTAVALSTAGLAVGVGTWGGDAAPTQPVVNAASSPLPQVVEEAGSLLRAHADSAPAGQGRPGLGGAGQRPSRSVERPPLLKVQRKAKAASLPPNRQTLGGAMTTSVPPPTPREVAMTLLAQQGWDSGQFSCLDALWTRESDWNPYAKNVYSGAYGIPQALPGSKMATYGGDWATNPTTQIEWGLNYIRASYGSPCGAWYHSESYGWY